MSATTSCPRCGVRPATAAGTCKLCDRAGPATWRLDRPLTWLPAASVAAVVGTLASLLSVWAVLAALGHSSLPAAACAWWALLGAPVHLVGDWQGADFLARFDLALRVGAIPLGALGSLWMVVGGMLCARGLRAASERESVVAGALMAIPAAVLAAALAAMLRLQVPDVMLGKNSHLLDLQGSVSPLHAAAAALAWATAAGALGGLLRYALWSRGVEGRWDGIRRGAWPEAVGALITLSLVVVGAYAVWTPLQRSVSPPTGENVTSASAWARYAGVFVVVSSNPMALELGVPMSSTVEVTTPGTTEAEVVDAPVTWQSIAGGASRPLLMADLVPLLCAFCGGVLAGRLRGRGPWLVATVRLWFAQVVLLAAVLLLSGGWLLAGVEVPGVIPAPGLQVWGWWRVGVGLLWLIPLYLGSAIALILTSRRAS